MRPETQPYWLAPGSEICLVCEHRVVLEVIHRCAACDRGVCSQCAVSLRETHELVCRECHEQERGG